MGVDTPGRYDSDLIDRCIMIENQNEHPKAQDSEELEEQIAYLPDGTKVRVEYRINNLATCRRLEGEWKGQVAVCTVGSLKLAA